MVAYKTINGNRIIKDKRNKDKTGALALPKWSPTQVLNEPDAA